MSVVAQLWRHYCLAHLGSVYFLLPLIDVSYRWIRCQFIVDEWDTSLQHFALDHPTVRITWPSLVPVVAVFCNRLLFGPWGHFFSRAVALVVMVSQQWENHTSAFTFSLCLRNVYFTIQGKPCSYGRTVCFSSVLYLLVCGFWQWWLYIFSLE